VKAPALLAWLAPKVPHLRGLEVVCRSAHARADLTQIYQ